MTARDTSSSDSHLSRRRKQKPMWPRTPKSVGSMMKGEKLMTRRSAGASGWRGAQLASRRAEAAAAEL